MRKGLIKIGIGLLIAAFIWVILITVIGAIAEVTLLYDLALIVVAAIGFAILFIISIPVIIYGIIAGPEPPTEAPEIELWEQEIPRTEPASRLMTELKFGTLFIVIGFLMRLLLVDVVAKEYADAETIISAGGWVLLLFVVVGVLLIGFGIAEYAIAKKKTGSFIGA